MRLSAVDNRNLSCAKRAMVGEYNPEALFVSDKVIIGDNGEVTTRTGETAYRNVPHTEFVGDVTGIEHFSTCSVPDCFAARYRMKLPDGKAYTEVGHFLRETPQDWQFSNFSFVDVPQ